VSRDAAAARGAGVGRAVTGADGSRVAGGRLNLRRFPAIPFGARERRRTVAGPLSPNRDVT